MYICNLFLNGNSFALNTVLITTESLQGVLCSHSWRRVSSKEIEHSLRLFDQVLNKVHHTLTTTIKVCISVVIKHQFAFVKILDDFLSNIYTFYIQQFSNAFSVLT